MEPCSPATTYLQLLNAIMAGLAVLLGVLLAHRITLADRDRNHLNREVHLFLNLPCCEPEQKFLRHSDRKAP